MTITTQMNTEVSQLYVALFGRAPDAGGLAFWAGLRDTGQSVTQLADAMFGTSPARTYFPSFLTNQEIISSFYFNVLGRQADAGGLAFWTAKLNAVGATPGSVIAEMIGVIANYAGGDPAGTTSAALFNNRTAAAQFYAEHDGSLEHSTTVLAGVTSVAATVAEARTLVVATGAKGTIDAAGFSEISVGALSGDLTLANAGADAELVVRASLANLVGSSMFDFEPQWKLYYELADASGTSDTLAITIETADIVNAGFSVAGIENLIVDSLDTDANSHFNRVYLFDERLASLVVKGTVETDFDGDTTLTSFDATGLQAGTSVSTYRWSFSEDPTLQGGPGDDRFWTWSGNYTISGGAGNDEIRLGAGLDVATGGSGADTFVIAESSNRNKFATITDFTKSTALVPGDKIDLSWAVGYPSTAWVTAKLAVSGATLDACLDTAAGATNITASGHSTSRWFQYAGDTYIVVDKSDASTFQSGVDQFVKLVGLIDLSTLTMGFLDTLG